MLACAVVQSILDVNKPSPFGIIRPAGVGPSHRRKKVSSTHHYVRAYVNMGFYWSSKAFPVKESPSRFSTMSSSFPGNATSSRVYSTSAPGGILYTNGNTEKKKEGEGEGEMDRERRGDMRWRARAHRDGRQIGQGGMSYHSLYL